MCDEQAVSRFQQLRQRQTDGKLTGVEQAELDLLVQELEAAEARYLSPATERLRQEAKTLEAQNRALEVLAQRKERLARKLRDFLADAEVERRSIESEFAAVLAGSRGSETDT